MACSRAHVIKAALLAGFILLLLNVFGPRLEFKYDKQMNVIQKPSLQWPKRTRSSNAIVTHSNNRTQPKPLTPVIQQHTSQQATNITTVNSKNIGNVTLNTNNNPLTTLPIPTNTTQSPIQIINTTLSNIFVTESTNAVHNRNKTRTSTKLITIPTTTKTTIAHELTKFSSTKSNFIQSLMTTLGLNQCPSTPPDLEGQINVDTQYKVLSIIEKRYANKLEPGGWYHPSECNARDKVAIIVPYRDRKQHLSIFLNHMHPFLMKQQLEYAIFIVEQTSGELKIYDIFNLNWKTINRLRKVSLVL